MPGCPWWTQVLTTGLFLVLGLSGCDTVDRVLRDVSRPTAHLVGITLQDADLHSATLGLLVEITNPYQVPLPLVDVDYALASRGASFLTGEAGLQGTVPAQGTRQVQVPARLAFREVLQALDGVRPGEVVPYEAELGLRVDAPVVGLLRLPLRRAGQLPVPLAPEVRVREFTWDDLSLDRVGGMMVLEMVNHNQFPLTLSRLDYGVELAGVAVASAGLEERLRLGARGGHGEVRVPIEFSPRRLGQGLLSLVMNADADYGLDGEMEVETPQGGMRLPANALGRASFRRL